MSERMPVPAVNGGAVETLVDILIDKNERDSEYIFTILSPFDEKVLIDKNQRKNTKVEYLRTKGFLCFMRKAFYKILSNYNLFSSAQAASYLHSVNKNLKKNNQSFDLIVIENRPEFGNYLKNSGIAMVLHLHNDFLSINTKSANKQLSHYNGVMAVSNYIRDRVLEIDSSSKVTTLYNGVNSMQANVGKSELNEVRKKYGILDTDTLILFTSRRLIPEKGTLEIIKAFILSGLENTKMLIVGLIDSQFGEAMKNLALSSPNIIFAGYIDYDELPILYEMADIGAVPSIWPEPFGNTVIEHLSVGNPVIVSDRGGIPEIVTNKCASIVHYDNNYVYNLSKSIKELVKNDTKREKMSIAARERSNLFSSEVYWEAFKEKINYFM